MWFIFYLQNLANLRCTCTTQNGPWKYDSLLTSASTWIHCSWSSNPHDASPNVHVVCSGYAGMFGDSLYARLWWCVLRHAVLATIFTVAGLLAAVLNQLVGLSAYRPPFVMEIWFLPYCVILPRNHIRCNRMQEVMALVWLRPWHQEMQLPLKPDDKLLLQRKHQVKVEMTWNDNTSFGSEVLLDEKPWKLERCKWL